MKGRKRDENEGLTVTDLGGEKGGVCMCVCVRSKK